MKDILVALKDKQVTKDVLAVLKQDFKVEPKQVVVDGDAAWESLKSASYDLVVLDWDLDKTSSLAVFNRLRQDTKNHFAAVMVVSKSSQKERLALTKDYPPTGVAEGAFSSGAFSLKLGTLVKDAELYRADHPVLGGVAAAFKKDAGKATQAVGDLAKSAPNAITVWNIAAKRCMDAEQYSDAEKLLNEAMKINATNANTVMYQSKVYHVLGRHTRAFELMATYKFSAKDVARTLLSGEYALAAKNVEAAEAFFTKAQEIDKGSQRAKLGLEMVAQVKPWLKENGALAGSMQFGEMMTTIAAALVKVGKADVGQALVKAAIVFTYEAKAKERLNEALKKLGPAASAAA